MLVGSRVLGAAGLRPAGSLGRGEMLIHVWLIKTYFVQVLCAADRCRCSIDLRFRKRSRSCAFPAYRAYRCSVTPYPKGPIDVILNTASIC